MKIILFGHRGVGKSSLLKRVETYIPKLNSESCFCVDSLIEKECGQTIRGLVNQYGEKHFRSLEQETFFRVAEKLASKEAAVLALGAGYQGLFPKGWKVLWVQRAVSPKEFISRDRPSLASDGSLALPEERFLVREKLYREVADYEIEILEHRDQLCSAEKKYFQCLFEGKNLDLPENHFITLSPKALQSRGTLNTHWQWELRDDWLTSEEISKALDKKQGRVILSFRNKNVIEETKKRVLADFIEGDLLWDWPLEWGECSFAEPSIVSLHERKETLSETLQAFSGRKGILKLAVPIHNFSELRQGYEWFLKKPEKRVFLPSSMNGRWQWFRQLLAHKMPFHFVREGRGSSPDQPSLLKSLKFDPSIQKWGAILGQPVSHSLTPWFQEKFFGNALNIELGQSEWEEALVFLTELGMIRAAVTSPLKEQAFASIENKKENEDYAAVNTLQYFDKKWWGTNTDKFGFKKLTAELDFQKIAVWGGGGTLSAIKDKTPEAAFYSSRRGELREGREQFPDVVVWAVGRKNFDKEGKMPPRDWSPKMVIDLNYSDDSPGILCAETYGCQYLSGMGMFVAQAEAQQEFWKKYEC